MIKFQGNSICILLIVIVSGLGLNAQMLNMDTITYEFEELTVSDGLPAGMVWNVEADSRGMLWITTTKGFVRYDGEKVKIFNHDSNNKFTIPDKEYINVFIDNDDMIWLSDYRGNLCLFDHKKEKFVDLGVWGAPVKEFDDGSLWLRGKESMFTIQREIISQLMKESSEEGIQEMLKSNVVKKPLVNFASKPVSLGRHLYWIFDDTLYRDDGKASIQKKELGKITYGVPYDSKPLLVRDEVKNTLYLFYNYTLFKISNWEEGFKKVATIPKVIGNTFPWLVDYDGNIWLTENSRDIYKLSPDDLKITQIIKMNKGITPVQVVQNRRLKLDRSGNIWIPTNGHGLKKFGGHQSKFRYFGINHEGPIVGNLRSTNSDIIYWGRNSIEIFDIKKKRIIGRIDFGEYKPCHRSGNVFIFNEDQQQFELYFKCSEKPIYEKHIFSKTGQKRNTSTIKKEVFDWLSEKMSYRMTANYHFVLDPKNDSDAMHDTLFILDNKSNKLVSQYGIDKSLNWDISFSLETSDYLWIISADKGILRFSISNKKWEFYDIQKEEYSAFQKINFVLADPFEERQIWLATDKGLVRFDSKTNTIQRFSNTSHGFANDVIYSIQVDDKGFFWMDTNNGLIMFDPASETHRNFYYEDGLQHPEFNSGSSAYKDGIMYFGGMGGLTYFNPNDFHRDTLSSDIVLNVLKVNNQEVRYENSSSVSGLTAPLHQNPSLALAHDENMVTVGFNVLDFGNPKAHAYQYRFKNRDRSWQDIGNTNELTFSNLSHGNYKFEVRGVNRNHRLSDNIASLNFTIKTPWWRTLWFMGLVVVLSIGLLYALLKYRQQQKEKIVNLRNRISQDLHDEIGSTLSSISLFGTVAKKLIDSDKGGSQQMLDRINDSTTEVMESMNDIVWAINSENDKVDNLAKRMRAFASELSDVSEIRVTFDIDEKLKEESINMVQRRNVYLIYKEAINNAFKYSKAAHINVSLDQNQKRMMLVIRDDGIGFDRDNLDNMSTLGGNGLKNMESRAKELQGILTIKSKKEEGTEIRFIWNPKFEPKLN